MAATGNSFAERFARWQLMVENLKDTEEIGHLAPDQQLLERQLAEARVLESRLEDLRSQFRTVTARMRRLATEGDSSRGRLAASLQGKFGFGNETLLRYGVKLRRPPRRRPKQQTPEPTAPEASPAA
ncbi:MAG TPA: hypothetical protein VF121_11265 [Thermoanaerobaculia bacterium]|nr:hypothetical protein [Thermoanaerobaculia bacterium]